MLDNVTNSKILFPLLMIYGLIFKHGNKIFHCTEIINENRQSKMKCVYSDIQNKEFEMQILANFYFLPYLPMYQPFLSLLGRVIFLLEKLA